MTGDLVKAMRACPQLVIAGVDGLRRCRCNDCAGERFAPRFPAAKTAFLFTRVGLAGCDMGACALLPRVIGQGRAAELLFTGRTMTADEGERWGFYNRLVPAEVLETDAIALAQKARARTDLRAHDDQDHAQPGMVDVGRASHRSRGTGTGDLHAGPGFQARL